MRFWPACGIAGILLLGACSSGDDAGTETPASTTADVGCQLPEPAVADGERELLRLIGGGACNLGIDGLGMTGWREGASMRTRHGTAPLHVVTNPPWVGTVRVSESPAPDIFERAPTDMYTAVKTAAGYEIRPPKGDGCRVLVLRFSSARPATDAVHYFIVWDKQGSSDCVATRSLATTTTIA